MTILKTAVWGSTIVFRSQFLDEAGVVMSPTSARIRVRQGRTSIEADLDPETDDFFSYRLDTSGFKPGAIHWAIDAESGDTRVSEDGSITLTANPARAAAA